MKKELFIQNNIVSIDRGSKRKPPTITIALQMPHYLPECQKNADELIDRLLKQAMGRDIVLCQLSLTWNYNERELQKELNPPSKQEIR